MTQRELLFAALSGKPVDRLPVWLLFPYHTTAYYVDVRTNPCYVPIFERSRDQAIMLDRRNPVVSLFAPEVEQVDEKLDEDGWTISRRILRYRGEQLVSETRSRGSETIIKRLLETEDDLDILLRFPFNHDPRQIEAELERQMTQYRREKAEFPSQYGAMMLDLGEPISFLYHNSNLQEYTIWSLTCPEKVVAFLDRAMPIYRQVYDYCLNRDLADVYFLVGSELASPPMVSRETFQQWIVPYAKELIGMIHAHGKLAIQHYHGQIKLVLEDFLEMGPDGLHTIEAPPTGNCTLREAYEVLGNRVTLIGNVQYDLFRSLTPQQMREEVRKVVEEVAGRRFILSPSAGPYEPTISKQMTENYLTFLDAAREFGPLHARKR